MRENVAKAYASISLLWVPPARRREEQAREVPLLFLEESRPA
jgi:hypothetical protein